MESNSEKVKKNLQLLQSSLPNLGDEELENQINSKFNEAYIICDRASLANNRYDELDALIKTMKKDKNLLPKLAEIVYLEMKFTHYKNLLKDICNDIHETVGKAI